MNIPQRAAARETSARPITQKHETKIATKPPAKSAIPKSPELRSNQNAKTQPKTPQKILIFKIFEAVFFRKFSKFASSF